KRLEWGGAGQANQRLGLCLCSFTTFEIYALRKSPCGAKERTDLVISVQICAIAKKTAKVLLLPIQTNRYPVGAYCVYEYGGAL
ncbi:MAG: hypothetical protein RMN25_14705, partial [Anaerolineae bacterium]|nr:hypothetical protein [Thermoflexales bacterium]MDW8409022.1 hypothetical protein [Anaerolineae bacterium]